MSKLTVFEYWIQSAHQSPAAVDLAQRLGLDLPTPETQGFKCGLMYPMRRLVITGEDTPENRAIFFGPDWEAETKDLHQDCRVEVLLAQGNPPPEGSPAHAMSAFMDEGCPGWKPRPAEEDEKAVLAEFPDFQKRMAEALDGK
ncbi:MAG: hypothetical protein L6R41_008168 [Letrouitia leprolyta]|nr:MAG: hypothetical protein L6R41_008168 [Letrouitia leprolyta]